MPTPIVNRLLKDIKNGDTPMVIICGERRTGKTAFAMRIGYEVYGEKFKYANVVDTIEKFAQAVKNNRFNIIILDEASSALYIHDWSSYLHKVFNIIQDSQAYRHLIVFVLLPGVYKLDNMTKWDVNYILEMEKSSIWDDNLGRFRKCHNYKYLVHIKQYSSFKRREPMLKYVGKFWDVPLPPPYLWEPYISTGQTEFKEKILDEQLDIILKKNAKGQPREKPIF